jgi:hypothetical protein
MPEYHPVTMDYWKLKSARDYTIWLLSGMTGLEEMEVFSYNDVN